MADYIIAPTGSSGGGTLSNPWVTSDLYTATPTTYTPGVVLTTLTANDTLYFRGGTYTITGPTNRLAPLIVPVNSGANGSPITLRPYQGESVTIEYGTVGGPIFGVEPTSVNGAANNYIRFQGFTVQPAAGTNSGPAFRLAGTGSEIGYCKLIGNYVATSDNHPGIRTEQCTSPWIHHNEIVGYQGDSANSVAIELYTTQLATTEDNYFHDNYGGISDKDCGGFLAGNQNTYRRNWIANHNTNGTGIGPGFFGNNNVGPTKTFATYYIYDNVIQNNGGWNLGSLNIGSQVFNNLVIQGTNGGAMTAFYGKSGSGGDAQISAWNNILLTTIATSSGFYDDSSAFPGSGSTAPLLYYDYNVYNVLPQYTFTNGTFTLAQLRANAPPFETNAKQDTAANIFVDQVSYVLKGIYPTAGRFGDMVGPRNGSPVGPSNIPAPNSVFQIMNSSRYGPQAMPLSQATAISGPPYEKLTAGTTKSVSPGRGW